MSSMWGSKLMVSPPDRKKINHSYMQDSTIRTAEYSLCDQNTLLNTSVTSLVYSHSLHPNRRTASGSHLVSVSGCFQQTARQRRGDIPEFTHHNTHNRKTATGFAHPYACACSNRCVMYCITQHSK